jgi:cold shock CspA family protein
MRVANSRNRRSWALSRTYLLLYRLLAGQGAYLAAATKEQTMKYFGTVKTFDTITGHGEIKPEVAGSDLPFQRGAIAWDRTIEPTVGQRLSYDIGQGEDRQRCALNLQTI